jgi:4-hydroxythreonine-4-phosphate dehydrogenase
LAVQTQGEKVSFVETKLTTVTLTTVALTMGDAAGVGPELLAKALSTTTVPEHTAWVIVGDRWIWERAQKFSSVAVPCTTITSFEQAKAGLSFLELPLLQESQVPLGKANALAGRAILQTLEFCLDAATANQIQAICFAPLNKQAMKLGGLKFDDEASHFANYLGITDFYCEFNTLGDLWTARVSSHIPLKDAAQYITKERIDAAASLIHKALVAYGIAKPVIAVAAFNPHGGDGGTCGREEIDTIIPAVAKLQAKGMDARGPFPADTLFIKAREGVYQAVVTMYHDQGQIAIKLMGFERGVTVHGGLPIPITTPAHGTAYDLAGTGTATTQAMSNALMVATKMGASI